MPTSGAVRGIVDVVSTLPGFLRTRVARLAYSEEGTRIVRAPPAARLAGRYAVELHVPQASQRRFLIEEGFF